MAGAASARFSSEAAAIARPWNRASPAARAALSPTIAVMNRVAAGNQMRK